MRKNATIVKVYSKGMEYKGRKSIVSLSQAPQSLKSPQSQLVKKNLVITMELESSDLRN